jgi:2-polyprenyl-3-methyl-5-hydroxy-6-metoxy-1,4-benzoquinol methylase
VYRTKDESQVSWHQDEPAPSLTLVREFARPGGAVIDVGGGSSVLAGRLAAQGFDVTVLDIAPAALDRARARIGDPAVSGRIRWIVGDVTGIADVGTFDVWHDRAVFHFLTSEADRRRYIGLAARSVRPGGHLVIGTFALDGPEKCSGLAVQRYGEAALAAAFSPHFTIVRSMIETHTTPWGKTQPFFFAVLRRS